MSRRSTRSRTIADKKHLRSVSSLKLVTTLPFGFMRCSKSFWTAVDEVAYVNDVDKAYYGLKWMNLAM